MRHNFDSLADVLNYTTQKYSRRTAFCSVDGDSSYTFSSFSDICRRQSRLLSNFGINAGDKVAILSQNMPNWPVAFFAVTAFGRIAVPMLTELTTNEITNILTHSESKALYVSRRLYSKVPEDILARMHVVIATEDLSILRADGTSYTCDGKPSNPIADDLACIIYTSGTTGAAKGVMLTHKNFCANIYASWIAAPATRRDVFLSILPLGHTYEMTVGMLYPFSTGARVCYLNKPPTPSVLLPALKKLRPTMMLSVPLVIEKIYKSSILPTISKSKFLSWLDKTSHSLLCLLVGMRLKQTFGGRIHFFGIGGAKLDAEVEAFLAKAKFPYAIGYGLTETAPLICNANPHQTHLGTTGIAAAGVTIRLDNVNPQTGEGEIVVKGDNVMMGYYKDYERTQQVLSADGWLRTGDLASVDKRGRYSIKGRLGSVILGPSGENIYPEEIENVINNINDWNYENQDRFIEDLERRKQDILDFVNAHVNRSSRIKEVEVEKQPFAKTATMKIKRFLYKDKQSETDSK